MVSDVEAKNHGKGRARKAWCENSCKLFFLYLLRIRNQNMLVSMHNHCLIYWCSIDVYWYSFLLSISFKTLHALPLAAYLPPLVKAIWNIFKFILFLHMFIFQTTIYFCFSIKYMTCIFSLNPPCMKDHVCMLIIFTHIPYLGCILYIVPHRADECINIRWEHGS